MVLVEAVELDLKPSASASLSSAVFCLNAFVKSACSSAVVCLSAFVNSACSSAVLLSTAVNAASFAVFVTRRSILPTTSEARESTNSSRCSSVHICGFRFSSAVEVGSGSRIWTLPSDPNDPEKVDSFDLKGLSFALSPAFPKKAFELNEMPSSDSLVFHDSWLDWNEFPNGFLILESEPDNPNPND